MTDVTNQTKRVVSKRTKLLFIGFGAAGIALLSLLYGMDFDQAAQKQVKATHITPAIAPSHATR